MCLQKTLFPCVTESVEMTRHCKLLTATPDQVLEIVEAERQQLLMQMVDAEVGWPGIIHHHHHHQYCHYHHHHPSSLVSSSSSSIIISIVIIIIILSGMRIFRGFAEIR